MSKYHDTTGYCVVCRKLAMYRTEAGECEECVGKYEPPNIPPEQLAWHPDSPKGKS